MNQTDKLNQTKICRNCGRDLPRDEFYKASKSKDGLKWNCKECDREKASDYYRKNEDRVRKNVRRYKKDNPERVKAWDRKKKNVTAAARRRHAYGLSEDDYERMLVKCGGMCESCGRDPWEVSSRGPHVDHCHETGRVRGILCFRCNTGLGHFRDSIEDMENAVAYLRKYVVE